MKTIPYKLALARAEAAAVAEEIWLLEECRKGNRGARSYLRTLYTASEEYDRLNPRSLPNEDGPCAGWGCDTILIS